MQCVSADDLARFAAAVLAAGGAPLEEAESVARSLVNSDLRGHESHGVMRLASYIEKLDRREVVPAARLETLKETEALLIADGGWGFGQVQARRLVTRLIDKAAAAGTAIGTLRRVTHVGRLGEYCEMAAEAGFLSQLMANSHGNQRWVAPPGGREARLGTNPMGYGIPNGDSPIIFDFSTAASAEGAVRLKRISSEPCPEPWLLDANGRPTTDPEALYGNPPGTIRPLGGEQDYKGFGLGLVAEVFAGGLSGGVCARPQPLNPKGNCLFVQLIDPNALLDGQEFAAEVARLVEYVKSRPECDRGFDITIPGDRSRRELQARQRDGIPIVDECWRELIRLAERFKIDAPRTSDNGDPWKPPPIDSTRAGLRTDSISSSATR